MTLSLAKRLGVVGYGRIEFAFNVVFWLVLLVRDSSDVIVARELSRHPRLIKPLVDHVLAIKGLFSLVLFTGLAIVGALTLRDRADWWVLTLYGLMLFTTAIGLDFVYRGTECMGLLAVSLCLRTFIYAVGVLAWVGDPSRIIWVPIWLAIGETSGIAIVWLHYLKNYRLPRPRLGLRFVSIILQRGRTVCLIQLSQAVISTADLLVVGLMSSWWDVGRYGAPHRMVTALLTFGLIFQQAAFPTLSRLWRHTARVGREALDLLVEVQVTALVPVVIGGTVLAEPLVRLVLPEDYAGAGLLLSLGIWRAPLLILAFLYQTALIALNREAVGVRSLVLAALGIGPLVAIMRLEVRASRGSRGSDPAGPGPGSGGLWKPRPGGAAAGVAPSSGPASCGLALDGTGLPDLAALACDAGGLRRRGDLLRDPREPGWLAADKAVAIGPPAAFGPGVRALIPSGSSRRTKAPQRGATGGRR